MFYGEIITYLRTVEPITDHLTLKNDLPAIFANEAPEDAVKPYIVLRIENNNTPGRVVFQSDLYINFYDFGKSRLNADECAMAIENALDQRKISTDNLSDVRFTLISSGYEEGSDPRDIDYNLVFSCRGARKRWMIINN
jgi:hypothetical protein